MQHTGFFEPGVSRNKVRRPVSRVLSHIVPWNDAGDDHSSRAPLARRLKQPTRTSAWRRACFTGVKRVSLFGLAPGGACRTPFLAVGAVSSYPTVSPLPRQSAAVWFLWRFPWTDPSRSAEISPAPCLHGARTFLSRQVSLIAAAAVQPSDLPSPPRKRRPWSSAV